MTVDEFWKHIDASVSDDQDEQLERLRGSLAKCTAAELVDFDAHLRARLNEAYRNDLWGAAYLINGGASDDGFEYFRLWLVGRGRKVFDAALKSPDALARVNVEDEEAEFESLLYLADKVYEKRMGQRLPHRASQIPSEPAGEVWDFDDEDEMREHLPKLAKKYLD
jgi:hypothetical protein